MKKFADYCKDFANQDLAVLMMYAFNNNNNNNLRF